MASHPIKEWLTSICPAFADLYADAFVAYGYEDTALLGAVDEEALMAAMQDEDTNVKKGHQQVIIAAFKKLRASTKDGTQEEASPPDHALGIAGERGLLNRYLTTNNKFRLREVRLDTDAGSLYIVGDTASSNETISLDGASIDRCPEISRGKRKVSTVSDIDFKFTFCIRHGDGKELLLQANNHEIFCAWTDAIANAGATLKDSGKFETVLCDPQFTLVPIGGSGVGKSTFVNLIIGAMWIKESDGCPVGYEDADFVASASVTESATKASDSKVVRRQWCGRSGVFKIMDTPGVFDVKGATADTENIGAVVEKLQEEGEVDCFALVINAAESRFSPQQAETIAVFDRILSSESAGSFLDHTVVVINQARRPQFDDEQKTKSDYVRMIRVSLQTLKSQEPKDGMAALVEQHRGCKRNMYDDNELFLRLESRCVLFPCFYDATFTHSKARSAMKQMWQYTLQLKDKGPFDCREVRETRTRIMEIEKELEAEKAKTTELEEKVKHLEQTQQELQQLRKSVEEKIRAGEESGHVLTEEREHLEAINDVARKASAQLEVTRKASMYQASNVQGFIDVFRDQAQHVNDTSSRVWLVVSSPEYGSDGEGGYKFPTMNQIVMLSKQRANVMIGYDWANSTSTFEEDDPLWASIFEQDEWGLEWDGKSGEDKAQIMQENEKKAARIWKKTEGGIQMQALKQISDAVKQTSWYKAYVGKVKGAVSTLCQQGRAVTLVCIEGGPVTRVEQMEMTTIMMEIKGDLKASYSIDADIDQKTFATFHDMKQCFDELGVGRTSQGLGSPRFRNDSADDGGDNVSAVDSSSNGNGGSSSIDGDSIGNSGDSGSGYQGQRWLIFLRHGESEGNVDEERYKNTPTSQLKLTQLGEEQAVKAGRSIVEKIGSGRVAIFCSAFQRAVETMDKVKEAIADYGAGIQVTYESDPPCDELNEQKYGNAAGIATIGVRKAERERYGGYDYCFPDGGRCLCYQLH
jgi:hypothetical protein